MPATLTEPSPPRFAFGENWSRFLRTVTEDRIAAATQSLRNVLGDDLHGKRFLDIGCGSGLFSLAAHRLGAEVVSFDFDVDSVACAEELRRREGAAPERWRIERGSVLDADYLAGLDEFDVVYAWGVLHHTGAMWTAIDLASQRVGPAGVLWIAVYNDQGVWSRMWRVVKRCYVSLPAWLRPAYVVVVGGTWAAQRAVRLVLRRLTERVLVREQPHPVASHQRARGMHLWYDLVDWIGGYPFEVAKPEDVFRFVRDRGFSLVELNTCGGGLGCNEFVFRRNR
uniref:Class I SAM-dependent methyltransferase n=1 Tax=Schlesneria paludicola TaxID=360056 RepID=A0A7C2JZZ6_9PLAN